MFFNDDDHWSTSPDYMEFVRREIYSYNSNLIMDPYAIRNVPTHTEDGIPIRKLYVSNLPAKTTRSELFGMFAQFGFIKSCWVKMNDFGARDFSPVYAFVTYNNPADAHKVLLAPQHEKTLRGKQLRISPADSWHQPVEDSNGILQWKVRGDKRRDDTALPSSANGIPQQDSYLNGGLPVGEENIESSYQENSETSTVPSENDTILEVLNMDCLSYILSYIPMRELILTERVSKGWQNIIQQYLSSVRVFKTSWWLNAPVGLTTAVLRNILQRFGGSLTRLHVDHLWSVLNDRTAHIIGKFCPELEELEVIGMHTKNWNSLMYGCKKLRNITFRSCTKLTDSSLVQLMKIGLSIENITLAHNNHVTGLFLASSNLTRLNSLALHNCLKMQASVLTVAANSLTNLTTLKLQECTLQMWNIIPRVLKKLPKLVELSLTEFLDKPSTMDDNDETSFCEAIATLTKLKKLDLNKNILITNAVLLQVAESCPYLEYLDVSSCNSRKGPLNTVVGVGDEGVAAVCRGCTVLRSLAVSFLVTLTDAGLRYLPRLTCLTNFIARGVGSVTSTPLVACLASCHKLTEMDVCGCDRISTEELCTAATAELERYPRRLELRIAATMSMLSQDEPPPLSKYLCLDLYDEMTMDYARGNDMDYNFDDSADESTDDSFDDLLNNEDLFMDNDHMYLPDDMDDLVDYLDLAFHARELIIL